MYEVSEAYLTALKEKAVKDSISGTVTLTDGTVIEVSDSVLVKNTLKITKELCSDNYRIGTFNLSCLKMTIYDDNALGRDYSGAKISLSYKLFLGQDFSSFESVPLGIFTVEGKSVVRRKNRVTLTAYDNGIYFDVEPSESIRSSSYSAAALVQALCGFCGVELGGIAEGLPNSSVVVCPSDGQLQSCRDIIMWAAALMCGYAVIGRDGKLYIISAKYKVSEENSSETVIDRYITEKERSSIYSTDTRAYIKYISAYCEGKVKEYSSNYTPEDEQAAPAVYALAKNPLISDKNAEECDSINESWLSYIDGFKQRGVNARIFGDPAIDLGDTIRFSGGDVDQRRSIVGVVTAIEWKYRNYQDIICTAAQCGEALSSASSYTPVASKSQTEKRIDGIKAGGVGKNVGGGSEIFNCYSGDTANSIQDSIYAHAEGGENNISNSSYAHAEGNFNSIFYSEKSHAEGESSKIFDSKWAHAGGYGCYIISHADCGFAHGAGARVTGGVAAAFGSRTLAAGRNQFVAGKGNIEDNEDKYALIIGNGTEDLPRGYTGFEASNALTLDWEGNLWVSGDINFSGGAVTNYKAGKGIEISEGKISINIASENVLGGVKAGDGVEIAADGTISVTGGAGGGSYTAGSGIEIAEDNTISVTPATDTALGGIILGEGLEYDAATGKTNTVPNIQQAVIIQEADANYLLHEYTTIEYIAGNKIVYAGADNSIIVNENLAVKNTVDKKAETTKYVFGAVSAANNTSAVINDYDIEMAIVSVSPQNAVIKAVSSKTGISIVSNPVTTLDLSKSGLRLVWSAIYSPGTLDKFPNGYVQAIVQIVYTTPAVQTNNVATLYIGFSSEAEYNAAVGLTYEPNTLTQVNETITQV